MSVGAGAAAAAVAGAELAAGALAELPCLAADLAVVTKALASLSAACLDDDWPFACCAVLRAAALPAVACGRRNAASAQTNTAFLN